MATGYQKCPDCGYDVLKSANECKNCGHSFVGGGDRLEATEHRRYAKVELYVDQFRLVGTIVLGGAGFDFRLSDFLNTKAQRFFPLLDAAFYSSTGERLRSHGVVMVNKEDVRILVPLEEPERDERSEGVVSAVTNRY